LIRATLEGRLAAATLNGFSMSVAVARGCPQGGELLILINLMLILMMPTEETINSDAYIRELTEFKKCFK